MHKRRLMSEGGGVGSDRREGAGFAGRRRGTKCFLERGKLSLALALVAFLESKDSWPPICFSLAPPLPSGDWAVTYAHVWFFHMTRLTTDLAFRWEKHIWGVGLAVGPSALRWHSLLGGGFERRPENYTIFHNECYIDVSVIALSIDFLLIRFSCFCRWLFQCSTVQCSNLWADKWLILHLLGGPTGLNSWGSWCWPFLYLVHSPHPPRAFKTAPTLLCLLNCRWVCRQNIVA